MLRKAIIVLSLMLTASILFYNSAHTHSGRTDANGGHYNRKTGEYHYHNSGRSRSRFQAPTEPHRVSTPPRLQRHP